MEHLEHFTRNNVEVKKIITFSLNHSFCRADHRHVSLVHTQVQSQLFRVVRAKRGISLHTVHTSASTGILASPWYQTAAYCPGVCKISL